jgi:hypothetical protein
MGGTSKRRMSFGTFVLTTSLPFSATEARRLYAAPRHLMCTLSGC